MTAPALITRTCMTNNMPLARVDTVEASSTASFTSDISFVRVDLATGPDTLPEVEVEVEICLDAEALPAVDPQQPPPHLNLDIDLTVIAHSAFAHKRSCSTLGKSSSAARPTFLMSVRMLIDSPNVDSTELIVLFASAMISVIAALLVTAAMAFEAEMLTPRAAVAEVGVSHERRRGMSSAQIMMANSSKGVSHDQMT